ncbi:lactonase family protein [Sphingobium naphthae]|uniref:Lactonase family protein n=1 Tax=Sphingobium naphthae TaxID=1886786 RepID=A0ABU3ZZJ0_9SPHN|nr:lactonase family protein [Sphingobium naphthae]MDV5824939.1 lactonase family protein [Sphingobium naphthae]
MQTSTEPLLLFIGSQGQGEDQGIHAARFFPASGKLDVLGLSAVVARPTWVLADPRRPVLYAVSEVGNAGDRIGNVLSFSIGGENGSLSLLASVPSGGGGPTHLALDREGTTLCVANFGGGEVALVPVSDHGDLAPVCALRIGSGSGPHRRQKCAHAHGVTLDPTGRYLLAPDMGADRIFIYPYDAAGRTLGDDPNLHASVPAGSGPRLILFGKGGRFAYLLSELSAEFFVFAWNAEGGRLELLSSIALDGPDTGSEPSAAGFAISPDGAFLYATNRTVPAIHVFAIDPECGLLMPQQIVPTLGEKPWALEFSPGGDWLLCANQASDEVRVFAVERATGLLSDSGNAIAVPAPTSVAFSIPLGAIQ